KQQARARRDTDRFGGRQWYAARDVPDRRDELRQEREDGGPQRDHARAARPCEHEHLVYAQLARSRVERSVARDCAVTRFGTTGMAQVWPWGALMPCGAR